MNLVLNIRKVSTSYSKTKQINLPWSLGYRSTKVLIIIVGLASLGRRSVQMDYNLKKRIILQTKSELVTTASLTPGAADNSKGLCFISITESNLV